jgi:uncharacterized membrane protein (DUF106 family)
MKTHKKYQKSGMLPTAPVSRPTVSTLLLRIAGSALTGDMGWFVFFCGVVIAFLHVNHFPIDGLLVLIIFTVLIFAIFRGIRIWRGELEEYQRNLSEYRRNIADIHKKQSVKKDIIWDRH